jgi:hypothetical protein
MLRSAIAGVLIYASGHPGLEDLRPGLLGDAMHAFHREVNTVVADGYRAVTSVNVEHVTGTIKAYYLRAEAEFRGRGGNN